MSVRQLILADIKTTLEAIPDIQSVEVNRANPVDISQTPLPACFIDSGIETIAPDNEQVGGFESWNWEVIIQCWAIDTDMEDLLSLIHIEMHKDNTRSGNAIDTRRTESDILDLQPDTSLLGLVMPFEIKYRHVFGIP